MMPRRTRGWGTAPSVSSIVLKPLTQKRSPELKEPQGRVFFGRPWLLELNFCKTLASREGGHEGEHVKKLEPGMGLKEKGLCGLGLPCPPLGKLALQP